jgi:hypothetical protein
MILCSSSVAPAAATNPAEPWCRDGTIQYRLWAQNRPKRYTPSFEIQAVTVWVYEIVVLVFCPDGAFNFQHVRVKLAPA